MPALIDFRHFTSAKNNFEGNPGLCNLFKFLAIETWKRLEFTYLKPYIKVYETTLTQNIAFTINTYKDRYPSLPIEIWESEDEKANGNDLELLLSFNNYNYDFYAPIQAKKIYRNETYMAMDHGDQIESLINYAENRNGFPMYLLYNYIDPIPGTINPDNELYGCSVIDANHLFNNYYNQRLKRKRDGTTELTWLIPDFHDLHPNYAIPWHELVCDISSPYNLMYQISRLAHNSNWQKKLTSLSDQTFKSMSGIPGIVDKQILSYEGWYKSSDKEIIKKDTQFITKELFSFDNKQSNYVFNPKTRIVVTL